MAFTDRNTPLPPVTDAPIRVTTGDWFDLAANSTYTALEHRTFRDQAIIVNEIGGRPEADVNLRADARLKRSGSSQQRRVSYAASATGGFDQPVDRGPVATDSLTLSVQNQSATDYTQAAAAAAYQFYATYTVRSLTVLDKLHRGIPLTREEEELMEQYDLRRRARLNAPPSQDPLYQPTLAAKSVRRDEAEVTAFDVDAGGTVQLLDETVRPSQVIYLTRLSVNGQEYTPDDDLTLTLTRAGTDEFYELETWSVPGQPFELDLHIPFFQRMQLTATAQNALAGVDVRAEYAVVDRTLQEKALYGFAGEVKADDDLADARSQLYETLRDLYRTGLPLEGAIEEFATVGGAEQMARR